LRFEQKLVSQIPETSPSLKTLEGEDKSDTETEMPSRPYFTRTEHERVGLGEKLGSSSMRQVTEMSSGLVSLEDEDEGESSAETEALAHDAREINRLWDVLAQDRTARRLLRHGASAMASKLPHGADLVLRIQGSTELAVHRAVLSARCAVLARVLGGFGSLYDRESGISVKLLPPPTPKSRAGPPSTPGEAPRLAVAGTHAFSVLVLVHYLYTDALLPLSDPRLPSSTTEAFTRARGCPGQIIRELRSLARVLHLEYVAEALQRPTCREPPLSVNAAFRAIFDAPVSAIPPDVVLQLADKDVLSHSFVLRARSPFFAVFFADEDWTAERWEEEDGPLIRVDLRHLEWRAMQYVLRFMCCGEEAEMFERLGRLLLFNQSLSLAERVESRFS